MSSPLRILAVAGVLALGVVAAVVIHGSFDMPVRFGTPEGRKVMAPGAAHETPDSSAGEDVVARALRLAAIDSTRKDKWVDDIPDLDLAALTPAARETFTRIANGRRCGCGCGFTLAGCRRFDAECETSGPRARALYDSVLAGRITRADGYRERPRGL